MPSLSGLPKYLLCAESRLWCQHGQCPLMGTSRHRYANSLAYGDPRVWPQREQQLALASWEAMPRTTDMTPEIRAKSQAKLKRLMAVKRVNRRKLLIQP